MMTELERYYNKFNEDKRLTSRRGQVEYRISMHFIKQCLAAVAAERGEEHAADITILDIGAATGAYSIPLSEAGYDVTAVEPVQHNLGRLKAKTDRVAAYKGDARNLKRFADHTFDLVLLFGPMYHLQGFEDKKKALSEAKRVCKTDGYLLVSYFMNDYAVLRYGFVEGNIQSSRTEGQLDEDYRILDGANPIYSYVRTEDIDALNAAVGVRREKLVSADGSANLIRRELNAMTDEMFEEYIRYHFKVCERGDMLGISAHLLDILRKEDVSDQI